MPITRDSSISFNRIAMRAEALPPVDIRPILFLLFYNIYKAITLEGTMRRKTGDTTNSSTNLTGWAACSAVAFALLGSSAALADEAADIADLKARLEALERAAATEATAGRSGGRTSTRR